MAAISRLPDRLKYLESVRLQLKAHARDEGYENVDLSRLKRAVQERVRGISEKLAQTLLSEDADELERWLAGDGKSEVYMNFLIPLLPEGLEIIAEPAKEAPLRGEARMELPTGCKPSWENGCLSATWKRVLLSAYPTTRNGLRVSVAQLHENAKLHAGITISHVHFGKVIGTKAASISTKPAYKQVNYGLEVPGGYTVVQLGSSRGQFAEEFWEELFPSLHIINSSPSTGQEDAASIVAMEMMGVRLPPADRPSRMV